MGRSTSRARTRRVRVACEYTVAIGLTVDGDTTGITIPYQVVVQTVGGETGVPTCGPPGSVTATPTASSKPSTSGSAITLDPSPRMGPSVTTSLWLGLVGALLLGGGMGAWIQLGRIRSRRSRVRS